MVDAKLFLHHVCKDHVVMAMSYCSLMKGLTCVLIGIKQVLLGLMDERKKMAQRYENKS